MAKNSYPLSYVSSNLSQILSEMIQEYGKEAEEKANKVTVKVAQDFAEKLRANTQRSGELGGQEHLADTVKVSERSERFAGKAGKVIYVHYGKWQIAHLLEFGWTSRNGKRVSRKPFVRPLFDNYRERYLRMYREELEK